MRYRWLGFNVERVMIVSAERRHYSMHPQKAYAGTVETEVLADGCIKYYILIHGAHEPTELVVDPSDENQMRGVRQLHLMLNKADNDSNDRNYIIDGESIEDVLASIEQMFRIRE